MTGSSPATSRQEWRRRWHDIIFEADSPSGKAFDIALLATISISVLAVAAESVSGIATRFGPELRVLEWTLTILFTLEYVLRLLVVERPATYARSFYGLVDLMAVLPTYLSLFFGGTQALAVIRALRLLRVFRIFKAARYVSEMNALMVAFRKTRHKILVFVFVVLCSVLIMGTLLYVIEGEASGFDNIPRSVYWAIVTMTTVGYGDIAPQTPLGQFIAAAAMVLGYGLIIIPTGLFAVELAHSTQEGVSTEHCSRCSLEGHDADARYCKRCGSRLHDGVEQARRTLASGTSDRERRGPGGGRNS